MDVHTYFELRAPGYPGRCQSGAWRLVRGWEANQVRRLCPPIQGRRVLEACAGAGFYTRWLAAQDPAQLVALDVSSAMLSQVRCPGVQTQVGDLRDFRDSGFDLIALLGGLEFLPDLATFWRFARRCGGSEASVLLLYPQAGVWSTLYRLYYRRQGLQLLTFDSARLKAVAREHGWRQDCRVRAGFSAEVARFSPL